MIGDKIRKRRLELDWSQEELAKRMGYKGRASISRIENNENDVTQTNLKKFAEVLGVAPTYFLFDDVEETQNELFERNKVLFDLSKKVKPEDLEAIIKIVERMTEEE